MDESSKPDDFILPSGLKNNYVLSEHRYEKIMKVINFLIWKKNDNQKIIIFVNTCYSVDFYTKIIMNLSSFRNIPVYGVHGKMKQKKRTKIANSFINEPQGILISTDLIARGIDFQDVNFILQIDPPQVNNNFFLFL